MSVRDLSKGGDMKTSNARRALQVVLAAGVAVGASQQPLAADIFLNIPGIPGESVDSKHKDDIDVTSYSQSLDERQCPQVAISKRVDKASPLLAEAVSEKKAIPSVSLVARRSGLKDTVEYLKLTMSFVTVLRSEHAVGESSAEEVVLGARSIAMTYTPTNPDGSAGKAVTGTIMCK